MTPAEQQIREALAEGPTPGTWEQKPEEVDKAYIRIRGTWLGHRYKIANVLTPTYEGVHEQEAQETRANARLIAACSPENILALLAEIERLTRALDATPSAPDASDIEWAGKVHLADAEATIERLTRERDEALAAAAEAHERANHWTAEAARYHEERDEARAECEALRAENYALRAALEPFVDSTAQYEASGIYTIGVHGRDLTAARVALAQIEQERSERAKEG